MVKNAPDPTPPEPTKTVAPSHLAVADRWDFAHNPSGCALSTPSEATDSRAHAASTIPPSRTPKTSPDTTRNSGPISPMGDSRMLIAAIVAQGETDLSDTCIPSSVATISDLHAECARVWHVTIQFDSEDKIHPSTTQLYYFDPRFVRRAPLFAVDLRPVHRLEPLTHRTRLSLGVVRFRVFNLDTSQKAYIYRRVVFRSFPFPVMVSTEWQWAFDFSSRNELCAPGTRVADFAS